MPIHRADILAYELTPVSTVAAVSESMARTKDLDPPSTLSQALTVVQARQLLAFCVPSSIVMFRAAAPLFCVNNGLFSSDDARQLVQDFLRHSRHKSLHDATEAGDLQASWAHIYCGTPVDLVDKYGCVPLHYAADKSETSVCKLLLYAKADIHVRHQGLNIRSGWTALHFAAYAGARDIAFLLLLQGADVNHLDGCRRTPLYYAESRGKNGVARLLKKYGGLVGSHFIEANHLKEALNYNDGEQFLQQDGGQRVQWDASADAADMFADGVAHSAPSFPDGNLADQDLWQNDSAAGAVGLGSSSGI